MTIKVVKNVLIGADPELFLRKVDTKEFFPSIGLIGGSKLSPRPIDEFGSCVQEDNVTVEFNIPPARSKTEFVSGITKVINYLADEVSKKGLILDFSASALFKPVHLRSPEAQTFGCEPDYNCWTGAVNPRPNGPKNLRSCGGHIHIGWDNPDMIQRIAVARAADLFIGSLGCLHDKDTRRRKLYGKSGACRYKQYGVEHRTSSNYWTKSMELMGMVYEQAHKAVAFVNSGAQIHDKDIQKIQDCINLGDQKLFDELNSIYRII